jgi:hypothetical protein
METKTNQSIDNSIGNKETSVRNQDAATEKRRSELPVRNLKLERGFSQKELAAKVHRIKPSEEKLV